VTPTSTVAGVAGRDQVDPGAVVPVVVQVINDQSIGVLRIGAFPANRPGAPVARMRAGTDSVVEHDPMDVGPAVGACQRMAREQAYPVALRIQGDGGGISGAGPLPALIVQPAPSVLGVRSSTAADQTPGGIPTVIDVPVVIQPPAVHLAEDPGPLVGFGATVNRAPDRPRRPLELTERVTVAEESDGVLLAVAMGVVLQPAPVNQASPHMASLRAREPGFYGATYCMRCQRHAPVSEFRWGIAPGGPVVGS
jgi:hypothetical protein